MHLRVPLGPAALKAADAAAACQFSLQAQKSHDEYTLLLLPVALKVSARPVVWKRAVLHVIIF